MRRGSKAGESPLAVIGEISLLWVVRFEECR